MTTGLEKTFKFRINDELLKRFLDACEANDMTAAQVLRAAVRSYVDREYQPQGDLLKTPRRAGK